MKKFILGLTVGAAIGSIVTYKVTKTKFERIIQDEIDSVKETFDKYKSNIPDTQSTPEEEDVSSQDGHGYTSLIDRCNYNACYEDDSENSQKEEEETPVDKPYVIAPEDFGELDGYDVISLIYYDDDVLCDDQDELVEDVEATVGESSLTHFGEYEDDSVFVRNDTLKCDFEILRSARKYYGDVYESKPYLRR